MDASDAVWYYGRHGVDLSGRDAQDCAGLASLLFSTLKEHFLVTLSEDPQQAVMIIDSCDGTPLTTRRRIFKKCGELEVIRRQKSTGEWLIQRKFLVTEAGKRCVLFGHPRKMAMNTAWAHFQATRELLGTGRELGHQGLLIEHTVLDRAIHTSLSRHMQEMSSMAHEVSSQGLSLTQAWLREQFTWTTSAGCTLHDLHNGFKKGMESYFDDKVFMRTLYGGVEGLRDSYSALVDGIGVWLPKAVRFKDWELPKQEQYELWVLLGLPPTVVDALLTLQMRFLGGRLYLAEDMERCPQSAQLVTTTLVSLWEFRE